MTSSAASTPPEPNYTQPSRTHYGRLLGFGVLAFLLFGGAILFVGFFDGIGWVRSLVAPPLAVAKGSVMVGKEPLPRGQVLTKPIGRNGRGSMGVVDTKGEFSLKTEVDGRYVDGAEVGTHKVIVLAQQSGGSLGAAAAPSAIASKFTSYDSTPLTIEITKDPASNVFTLVVEGNTPAAAESMSDLNSDKSSKAASEAGPESTPPEAK